MDLKVYEVQEGDPRRSVLLNFYERFRETQGPIRAEVGHLDVIKFAEYLLEHLVDFQAELERFKEIK